MKCCPVKIGSLNKRIEILNKTTTRNSGGGRDETWTISTKVWAKMQPKKLNPLRDANNLENQITHTITMPINTNLKKKSRLRYGSRYFFVQNYFNIDERDQYYMVEATENTKAQVTVS